MTTGSTLKTRQVKIRRKLFSKRTLTIVILCSIIVWLLAYPTNEWFIFPSIIDFDFNSFKFPITAPKSKEFFSKLASYLNPETHEIVTPGQLFARAGAKAKYPIVLIPGIISTGLELWEGLFCSSNYFRKRLWGSLTMLRFLFMDKQCLKKHLTLNEDGLDPEGIKLRAAQGLEAADYIMPGYWVWGKLIENLSQVGYDQNNLSLAAYDWRLSYKNLEERDHYFTRLKSTIELSLKIHKEKACIITHSMGSLVFYYFMNWVTSEVGGKGGKDWVDKHIQSFVNIGGPMLGAPKTVSSLLSGEMSDTVHLGTMESLILENFFSREERRDLFRTWGGLMSLMPKGGDQIWSSQLCPTKMMINFPPNCKYQSTYLNDIRNLFEQLVSPKLVDQIFDQYSHGLAIENNSSFFKDEPRYWSNPLESQLPIAPQMSIYCLYGVGKKTETSYFYRMEKPDDDLLSNATAIHLQKDYNDQDTLNGIYLTDGDGSVPLLSAGLMCFKGWRTKLYNPSSIKVVVREYQNQAIARVADVRGGPTTSDHVDIMGNHLMTEDVLRIVTDFAPVKDCIYSKIYQISKNIFI